MVFGARPHDYKQALSDLGGVDAKSHANDPEKAVLALRNWFVETVQLKRAPSGSTILEKFVQFRWDFYADRKRDGFLKQDLNYAGS